MSEHTILRKSRNAFSSFLHVIMKLLLGVGSILITLVSGSPIIGIILVFMGKWRIFAVRPRFWSLNIRSNLVDIIVGTSFVLLAYICGTDFNIIHIVLATTYSIWLLWVKSQTSENWILAQALICIFLGSAASIYIASTADSIFLCLAMFIVGYGASRHVFAQSSAYSIPIISFTSGLLAAEMAWLCSRWNIIYTFSSLDIMIPQFSILITILSFAFACTLRSLVRNDGKFNSKEILPPVLFSLITASVIIILFSSPIFNI